MSPDHITLGAVMSACGKAAEWQQSLSIFWTMLKEQARFRRLRKLFDELYSLMHSWGSQTCGTLDGNALTGAAGPCLL